MGIARVVTRLPVVQDFPALTRERIVATGYVVDLHAGDEVWDRGEGASAFTFLVEGGVRLLVPQAKQHEFLVDIVDSPGTLVCIPAVCGATPHCCRAVCARNSKLLSVPREALLQEVTSPVASLLLDQAAAQGMSLCRRLREVGGSKVQSRVVAVLLRLADERGVPCPEQGEGRVQIPSKISRRDLAGLSGCATETLIRVLALLEREGLISRGARGRLVIDVARLSDHAYAD